MPSAPGSSETASSPARPRGEVGGAHAAAFQPDAHLPETRIGQGNRVEPDLAWRSQDRGMHRPHFGDLPAQWMFTPVQLSLKAEFVLLILPCFRKPFSFRACTTGP